MVSSVLQETERMFSLLSVRSSQGLGFSTGEALLLEFSSARLKLCSASSVFHSLGLLDTPELNPDLKLHRIKWKLGRWSGGKQIVQGAGAT